MQKQILLLVFFIIPLITFSQKKISIGESSGLISISKENGLNQNISLGYNTSKNIIVGVDAMIGKINNGNYSAQTTSFLAYIEGSAQDKGTIKNKLFFSGILGLGYLDKKNDLFNQNAICAFGGSKLNYKPNENIIFGIKSGYYISKLENVIIANLFITYHL